MIPSRTSFLNVGLLVAHHVDGAAGVEAPHNYVEPGRAKLPAHVQCSRILIGLNTHQSDNDFGSGMTAPADDFLDRDLLGGFIEPTDLDRHAAEDLTVLDRLGEAV